MAEDTNTPTEQTQDQPTPTTPQGTDGTDWKAEARKWEARAKADHERLADYDAIKEKAAKYDEIAEAQKSDIERANDAATKAQAEAADWKSKYEAMQAESERNAQVAQFASQYKVDAGTLSRMAGDVEDNAKYLAGVEAARPKFGRIVDNGDQHHVTHSLDDLLKDAKNDQQRIRIRAEWKAEHRNR